MKAQEVVAGRMRHIWDGVRPDRVPLCGSWKMYQVQSSNSHTASWHRIELATDEDRERRHLCKTCERKAREKGLSL